MDIHGTSSAAAMGALPCFKAAWHRHNAWGYAFILPALLVILCLVCPFVMAIYLSLTDAWVGTEGKFVGFRNYSDLVLIGPSGCGKSTTLNLIAGIEEACEGRIFIGERPVNQLHRKDRDIEHHER